MPFFRGSSWPRDRTYVLYLLHWQVGSLTTSTTLEAFCLFYFSFYRGIYSLTTGHQPPWNSKASIILFYELLPVCSTSVWFSCSVMSDSLWPPCTAVCQASLSITNSWSLLKLMSIESVMLSNHLILCHPLLLLSSIFPSIRLFPNESGLHIRWPNYGF